MELAALLLFRLAPRIGRPNGFSRFWLLASGFWPRGTRNGWTGIGGRRLFEQGETEDVFDVQPCRIHQGHFESRRVTQQQRQLVSRPPAAAPAGMTF